MHNGKVDLVMGRKTSAFKLSYAWEHSNASSVTSNCFLWYQITLLQPQD